MMARFPLTDYKAIAAMARTGATSESDMLRRLARMGMDYARIHEEVTQLKWEISKLTKTVSDVRSLVVDEIRDEFSEQNRERHARMTAEIMLAIIRRTPGL